jgi:ATP-binding cassette, subfamily B, bacterial HlyB/CyaB
MWCRAGSFILQSVARRIIADEFLWALGSACALNKIAFDPNLTLGQYPAPHTESSLITAGRALGFRIQATQLAPAKLANINLPCIVALKVSADPTQVRLAMLTQCDGTHCVLFRAGHGQPNVLSLAELALEFSDTVYQFKAEVPAITDPDAQAGQGAAASNTSNTTSTFGFKWFVPELLKHKKVWRDVLLASLVLQLIALATPLFTQTIIDKVVVHRTQSTLIAITVAMVIFMVFSALLSWVRQYLILHTGNL